MERGGSTNNMDGRRLNNSIMVDIVLITNDGLLTTRFKRVSTNAFQLTRYKLQLTRYN